MDTAVLKRYNGRKMPRTKNTAVRTSGKGGKGKQHHVTAPNISKRHHRPGYHSRKFYRRVQRHGTVVNFIAKSHVKAAVISTLNDISSDPGTKGVPQRISSMYIRILLDYVQNTCLQAIARMTELEMAQDSEVRRHKKHILYPAALITTGLHSKSMLQLFQDNTKLVFPMNLYPAVTERRIEQHRQELRRKEKEAGRRAARKAEEQLRAKHAAQVEEVVGEAEVEEGTDSGGDQDA